MIKLNGNYLRLNIIKSTSVEILLQDTQWMVKTADSIELNILDIFLYVHHEEVA